MKIRSLMWQNNSFADQWLRRVYNRWTYDDFQADPEWRNGWISFDCAAYRTDDDRVYLGVTCFDSKNIFIAYDRRQDAFVELGYDRVADPFDAKFHRSLVLGQGGMLYAAPALLHCSDKYLDAPGAAVVRFDPTTEQIEKLGIPLPHVYVQSLLMAADNETLYALCFAPEYLISYHLPTRQTNVLGLVGSGYGGMAQGENIEFDAAGNVWCNWSLTRAWQSEPGPDAVRLAKYVPEEDRIHFYQHGLPYPDKNTAGFSKPEAWFNLGDGAMYASAANGSLYRIDATAGEVEYLFTPIKDRPSRLSSLAVVDDNVAYGITGGNGRCELMRVFFREGRFELLGPIVDEQKNVMFQCHHIIAAADDVLYACENDNPYRSSYLWEITL